MKAVFIYVVIRKLSSGVSRIFWAVDTENHLYGSHDLKKTCFWPLQYTRVCQSTMFSVWNKPLYSAVTSWEMTLSCGLGFQAWETLWMHVHRVKIWNHRAFSSHLGSLILLSLDCPNKLWLVTNPSQFYHHFRVIFQ